MWVHNINDHIINNHKHEWKPCNLWWYHMGAPLCVTCLVSSCPPEQVLPTYASSDNGVIWSHQLSSMHATKAITQGVLSSHIWRLYRYTLICIHELVWARYTPICIHELVWAWYIYTLPSEGIILHLGLAITPLYLYTISVDRPQGSRHNSMNESSMIHDRI